MNSLRAVGAESDSFRSHCKIISRVWFTRISSAILLNMTSTKRSAILTLLHTARVYLTSLQAICKALLDRPESTRLFVGFPSSLLCTQISMGLSQSSHCGRRRARTARCSRIESHSAITATRVRICDREEPKCICNVRGVGTRMVTQLTFCIQASATTSDRVGRQSSGPLR